MIVVVMVVGGASEGKVELGSTPAGASVVELIKLSSSEVVMAEPATDALAEDSDVVSSDPGCKGPEGNVELGSTPAGASLVGLVELSSSEVVVEEPATDVLAEDSDVPSSDPRWEGHVVGVVLAVVEASEGNVELGPTSAEASLVELVELSSSVVVVEEPATSSHHVVPMCAWHNSRVAS